MPFILQAIFHTFLHFLHGKQCLGGKNAWHLESDDTLFGGSSSLLIVNLENTMQVSFPSLPSILSPEPGLSPPSGAG